MTRPRLASTAIACLALVAVTGCGSDEPDTTTTTTTVAAPTTSSTAAPGTTVAADIPNATGKATITDTAHLVAVGIDGAQSKDVVTFDFKEGLPAYDIGYAQMPPRQDGSGQEVAVSGTAGLAVRFTQASTVDLTGGLKKTYTGPDRVSAEKKNPVTEVVKVSDYEGNLTWAIGVNERRSFTVSTEKLSDRSRVTVKFS